MIFFIASSSTIGAERELTRLCAAFRAERPHTNPLIHTYPHTQAAIASIVWPHCCEMLKRIFKMNFPIFPLNKIFKLPIDCNRFGRRSECMNRYDFCNSPVLVCEFQCRSKNSMHAKVHFTFYFSCNFLINEILIVLCSGEYYILKGLTVKLVVI